MKITMKLTLDGLLAALRLKAHGIADGLAHGNVKTPRHKARHGGNRPRGGVRD